MPAQLLRRRVIRSFQPQVAVFFIRPRKPLLGGSTQHISLSDVSAHPIRSPWAPLSGDVEMTFFSVPVNEAAFYTLFIATIFLIENQACSLRLDSSVLSYRFMPCYVNVSAQARPVGNLFPLQPTLVGTTR
jgi:hypothetical protein